MSGGLSSWIGETAQHAATFLEKVWLAMKSGSWELLIAEADIEAEFIVTAYTANDPGMDGRGITATGTKVTYGRTIAVDPKLIPYGSRIFIPALQHWPNRGWFIAEDTGGAIKGYRLDIFIPDRNEALKFGRQKLKAYVYKPSNPAAQANKWIEEFFEDPIGHIKEWIEGVSDKASGPFAGYENYECVYTTMQQFHALSSHSDIIDNQVIASSRDIITNVSVIYTRGSSPKTSPIVRADFTIRSDLQKTEIVDSGTVQDILGPDGVYSFLGVTLGEDVALAYGRNYLAERMRDMYRGELVTRGIPGIKPYDMISLNDTVNHMYGLCEVGRVVYMFSGETGFVTSIKPDLITTTDGKANTLARIITNGLAVGTFVCWNRVRLVQVMSAAVGAYRAARAAILTAKTARTVAAISAGIRGVIAGIRAIGTAGIVSFVITYLVTELINKALRKICIFFENLNRIKIFPLFLKGNYFVAGITGGKHIIAYDNDRIPPSIAEGEPGQQTIQASRGVLVFGSPSNRVGTVTSAFGEKRKKSSGGYREHKGVDLAFSEKDSPAPILAVASGTVKLVAYDRDGYGHYVIIDHGDGIETLYAHMKTVTVARGEPVYQGQVIGYQGSTGNSTGPHLHFELRINGKHVDPLEYLPPSSWRLP